MADSGVLDSGKERYPVSTHDIGTARVILKDEADGCSEETPHKIYGKATDTHNVTVAGGTHYILLDNLEIEYTDGDNNILTPGICAFDIQGDSVVHLELVGENTLQSGRYKAGLRLPKEATLTITAQKESGTLAALGGQRASGIGGHSGYAMPDGNGESCGVLTVRGFAGVDAKPMAYGTTGRAANGTAIGGGHADSSHAGGDGGIVTVAEDAWVVVTVDGDDTPTGIGGGYGNPGGHGGSLTILGNGKVTVRVSIGVAIGGGFGSSGSGGDGGVVVLGDGSDNPTLIVEMIDTGNSTILVTGVAMGGNGVAQGGNGGTVTLNSGTLTADAVAGGGYGDTTCGRGGTVNINGGTLVFADSPYYEDGATGIRLACGRGSADFAPSSAGGVVNLYGGSPDLTGAWLACGGSSKFFPAEDMGGPGGAVNLYGGSPDLTGARLACGGKGDGTSWIPGNEMFGTSGRPGAKGGPGGLVTFAGGTPTLTGAQLACGGEGGDGNPKAAANAANGGDGGIGGTLTIKGGSHNTDGARLAEGGFGGTAGSAGTVGATGEAGTIEGDVILYRLQLGSTPLTDREVTAFSANPGLGYEYGMEDVTTDGAGLLYLWLPTLQRTVWVSAGSSYSGALAPVGQVTVLKEATEPEPDSWIVYRLRSGKDQSWQGGDDGLVFVVDTQNGKFMGVGVDGGLIDSSAYTYEGSTLTLKPEYLATLSEGPHSLRIRYSDGAAETTFTVVAGGSPTTPTPGTPGTKPNPGTGR